MSMRPKVRIESQCDGWAVSIGDPPPGDDRSFLRRYTWDHNEIDLGVGALAAIFRDLGFQVEIEEVD